MKAGARRVKSEGEREGSALCTLTRKINKQVTKIDLHSTLGIGFQILSFSFFLCRLVLYVPFSSPPRIFSVAFFL